MLRPCHGRVKHSGRHRLDRENRERFEEVHDLIIKCRTEPGPFLYEEKHYHYRAVNSWVLPIQKPHPPGWFPSLSSPESVMWSPRHRHPCMNRSCLLEHTERLSQIYVDTVREAEFTLGPEHFRYLLLAPSGRGRQGLESTGRWDDFPVDRQTPTQVTQRAQ